MKIILVIALTVMPVVTCFSKGYERTWISKIEDKALSTYVRTIEYLPEIEKTAVGYIIFDSKSETPKGEVKLRLLDRDGKTSDDLHVATVENFSYSSVLQPTVFSSKEENTVSLIVDLGDGKYSVHTFSVSGKSLKESFTRQIRATSKFFTIRDGYVSKDKLVMVGAIGSEPFYCFFDLLKADTDKMSAIPLGPKGYIPSNVKPITDEMALVTANNISDSKLLLWSETLNSTVGVIPLNATIIEKIEVRKDSPRFYLIAKNQRAELDFLYFTLDPSHSSVASPSRNDFRSFTASALAKMLPVKGGTLSYGEAYPGSSDAVFIENKMIFFSKISGSINCYEIWGDQVKPQQFDLMTNSGPRGNLVVTRVNDNNFILAESVFPSDSDDGYKYSYINLMNVSTKK